MKKTKSQTHRSNSNEAATAENGLESKLEREIGSLVQSGQKREIISRVQKIFAQEHFSGPLPHPRHLAHYEATLPGAAERILNMAETEQIHSAEMDQMIVRAQIEDQKRGMNYGLFALILILGLATLFGFLGQNLTAGLFLGTAVLGSIPVFVNGPRKSAD